MSGIDTYTTTNGRTMYEMFHNNVAYAYEGSIIGCCPLTHKVYNWGESFWEFF